MRRLPLFLLAMALLGGGIAVAVGRPAAAQEAAHPLVGSWRVEVTVDGQPPLALPNLASFTADGIVLVSAPPLLPELPGSPARDAFSAGHGAWSATGSDTAAVTFVFLVVDDTGSLASENTVRGTLRVDPTGNAYEGGFDLSIAGADGAAIGSGTGTWRATRIDAGSGTATPAGA